MKLLVMDTDDEGMGVNFAWRAQSAGHDTSYWRPGIKPGNHGKGMIDLVPDWKEAIQSADLTVLTGNSEVTEDQHLMEDLAPYFSKGYPIFGANQKAAELELDRGVGQQILKRSGIKTLPYAIVDSPDTAVDYLLRKRQPYVMKPWGGHEDKSLTAVPADLNEAIFTVRKWQKDKLWKPGTQMMLQKKVEGIEMGIAAWFGPGGFSAAKEESWEHKKFLVGDLGENTGEMGTVLRHVKSSKLFDQVLEPLTDYLHVCNYVGDVSVNCIIDAKGNPWPLEFTMRLGWPDFNIRQEVILGDPVQWMFDLFRGQDTFRVKTDIAVGLVIAHGDFPKCPGPCTDWEGFPLSGIDALHWHPQQTMLRRTPKVVGGAEVTAEIHCTSGPYVCIVTGSGAIVSAAAQRATDAAHALGMPSNKMFRTDVGLKLKDQLPILQKLGYAEGMKY